VFSGATDQFYTVSCLDNTGNTVGGVTCTETCVVNLGASVGYCTTTGSNTDYLRTDEETVTYDCAGDSSKCEFTSYPGNGGQYYYDVSGSGSSPAGTASAPDCVCENTDVTPSGSPLSCTSFTSTIISTTDPASFTSACYACPSQDADGNILLGVGENILGDGVLYNVIQCVYQTEFCSYFVVGGNLANNYGYTTCPSQATPVLCDPCIGGEQCPTQDNIGSNLQFSASPIGTGVGFACTYASSSCFYYPDNTLITFLSVPSDQCPSLISC